MTKPGLFILGGSTYYTLLLFKAMRELGLHHRLGRITLFGRNEQRLNTIAQCGGLLFEGHVAVDYTLKLDDLLADDYSLVFNQMRFGGLKSRDQDEKIALEVGLFADETLGIVGASNAVRSIIGIKPFLEVIQQKQGDYRFVNFTNPCSIITQYIAQHYSIPVIGICDYPQMMRQVIAQHYRVSPQEVEARYFGINHFGFIYDVKVKGESKLAELCKADLPFKPAVNKYFDKLLNISWHYLFEQDAVVQAQRQKVNRAAQLLDIETELDKCVADHGLHVHKLLEILQQRQCNWFELVVAPLFEAILTGKEHKEYLNFACHSVLSVESSAVIEANAVMKSGCIELDCCSELPIDGPEFALVKQAKQAEVVMLDAILNRDFDGVIKSCLINPLIANNNKTIKYFDQLLAVDPDFSHLFT